MASSVALLVENMPANAGDIRDMGSIPGSGSFPGNFSILAWKIPWAGDSGEL